MYFILVLGLFIPVFLQAGQSYQTEENPKAVLQKVAKTQRQLTGVAVSEDKRVFSNFPYWSDDVPFSVAEWVDGEAVPYPNESWNDRSGKEAFQAVQSVVVDDANHLWVLDTNNPKFQGVKESGPVLYEFDLATNQKENAYTFPGEAYRTNSYFNDVRVDTEKQVAYLTDSGDGALIVLDLKTGKARRLLDDHHSVKPETDYLMCNGYKWESSVHSDGIALTPDGEFLYYIALSSHTLYRIPTAMLNDERLDAERLETYVEEVMAVPATDGMSFDDQGNLWMGGLENNAINQLGADGVLYQVVQDQSLRWVDTFAEGPEGHIYFTTAQIHLPQEKRKAYEVMKLHPADMQKKPLRKVLIAITSHGTLGENSGDSTGYYLSEVSHAYYVFKEAGFQVDFASPEGGTSPVDGYNLEDSYNKRFVEDEDAQQAIRNSMPVETVNPEDYRAIYYAGGHGTMWDFPGNKKFQEISRSIYEQGGVVSAVCHGPSALVNIRLSDDSYLVNGKQVAAFTNEEEKRSGQEEVVPFLLETKLEDRGATVKTAAPWQKQVVSDGRLITGQNPASAKEAASRVVKMLSK